MRRLFWLAIVAVLLSGCSESEPLNKEERAENRAERRRDESSLACDHFRNVHRDIADGIYTDEELREKLKEVDDNAIIATPKVRRAARQLLSAVTVGTIKDVARGLDRMSDACSEAGH